MKTVFEGQRVAIVGAGPAGLTLARLLQRRGANVAVYERDASPHERDQGGSLDLHEDSGLLAIRAMGLEGSFNALARPEGQHSRIFDKHGRQLVDLRAEDENASRPEIDRAVLRDLLLASLNPGTAHWGCALRRVAAVGSGYRLDFDNGCDAGADVVIGCDGAWSKVRPLRSSLQPSYGGITFIETRLAEADRRQPAVARFVGAGNVMAFGDNQGLLAQRNGDGSLRIYVALRVAGDWVQTCGIDFVHPAQARERLLQRFAEWSPTVTDLLRLSDDIFLPRPLHTFPPQQAWHAAERVTLLGDAAHLMPPFTGRGANMAMLDAVELAAHLTSGTHETLQAALDAYERGMLARMQSAIAETLAAQDLLFAPDIEDAVRMIAQ